MNRDNSIDAVAGVLIIYMIFVHAFQCLGVYKGDLYHYMQYLSFYMPWFFFKGGVFYNPKKWKEMIATGRGRLLWPFVKYSVIGYIVYVFALIVSGDENWIHYILTPIKSLLYYGSIPINYPLWFLLSLFMVRLIAKPIVEAKSSVLIIGVSLFCFLTGFVFNSYNITEPDYLLNVVTGTAFFLLGYIFRDIQYMKFMGILAAVIYILLEMFAFSSVEMRHNLLETGSYLVWPIICLSGIILSNNMSKVLQLKNNNIFVVAGRNSMMLFVWHYPIIVIIQTLYLFIFKL